MNLHHLLSGYCEGIVSRETSMANDKKSLGDFGERVAVEYLRKNKYEILETNYRNKIGEIDIISRFKQDLVFVEVKTRLDGTTDFLPENNVDRRKQAKLVKLCKIYLSSGLFHVEQNWRIDVISVVVSIDLHKANIHHFEGAVCEQ